MSVIKRALDPYGLMSPGSVLDDALRDPVLDLPHVTEFPAVSTTRSPASDQHSFDPR